MSNKTTKKALLTSVISLVLCFAMLVGTTFAWFTDNVTSTGNRIISGNLDVDLVMDKAEDGNYKSIANQTGDIFSAETGNGVKWEPGKTEIVYLGVKNKGNLALKYNIILDITDGGLVGSLEYALINGAKAADLSSATKWADIKDIDGVILGDVKAGKITVAQNGTLDEIAKGDEYEFETDYFALAVHMKEEAGNEYKSTKESGDKYITIDVLVSATQVDAELDSFGKDYDAGTTLPSGENMSIVSSVDDLKTAISEGKDVILTKDIKNVDANTAITVAAGKETTIDLNGHSITASADKTGNQELFLVKGTLTLKNGTVELGAENNQGWNSMATIFDVTAGGVLNLDGVTASVEGTDMNFIVHLNNWGSATLNVNNCDFTASYCAVRVFNSGYDMNNVTIKNTDFHGGRVLWVHNYTSEGKDDSTLNFDIYNNNNTSDNAKPVRFGFNSSLYYDINGDLIA